MKPTRIAPGPGQESVWDYPRPPRLETTPRHIQVYFNGLLLADTRRAYRVLETSHPPVYYLPPADIQMQCLIPAGGQSWCEWKGQAAYYSVVVGERRAENVAWYYPNPTPSFLPIKNYVAFYPRPMDRCLVDGEVVVPQPGGFYGGWITSDVVGPFKGEPGTMGW
ncbi:MAG: DUF427 domain-containing protein [Ardenticatenaceae bacterium]|nr:DUF427 domain-containing protein [Anaerolineales bacterium]MCB8919009.1 DUF427 domain-containing protein [Ardenticatenaceae bacterium]